jgi:hypothetical protein
MVDIRPVSVAIGVTNVMPQMLKYIFGGSLVGLLVGLGTVFVLALFQGHAIGLSPGSCVVYSCTLTLLLSHPAGIAGMVAGATVGAMAGGVVHYVHHSPRSA